jgi:hypothetical protein
MSTESTPSKAPAPQKIGLFKHIVRGCGTLPHCGEHPGMIPLFCCTLLGAAVGAQKGWATALGGAGIMFLIFGSVYLCGAYDRSVMEERMARKEKSD